LPVIAEIVLFQPIKRIKVALGLNLNKCRN